MNASRIAAQRARVGLDADEPGEALVRRALGSEYELCVGAEDCEVRLIGPHELRTRGTNAIREWRQHAPGTAVLVLLPAHADLSLVRTCFGEGAADVLPRDELEEGLEEAVCRLLGLCQADGEGLPARIRELECGLAGARDGFDRTLSALVSALDYRERESGHHSQRVALYSILFGLRLGLDETALANLYRGALLHDVGKVCTPEALLLKAGPLTSTEWDVMRQHAELGAAIVSGIDMLRDAGEVPMAHHEAWDGSGYPRGLREHEIPQNARLFAVADSYDAIRSGRPWKEPLPHEDALRSLQAAAGARLDPALVEVFCEESMTSWTDLDKLAGVTLTLAEALRACRQVIQR
jgi:HD-GYP domain-containing protein (c-di-GMP phosphodiesterase class II)